MTSEVFQRRLLQLFKEHDTDKNGHLDAQEFRQCMEGLDLRLAPAEVLALMASADTDGNGNVNILR